MVAPRVTIDELPEATGITSDDLLVLQDSGVTKKVTVALLTTTTDTALNAHLANATDAHDASAVSIVAISGLSASDVQAALVQLAGRTDPTALTPPTRTIATTAPLTGGGDLTANRTFAVDDFTTSTRGTVPASGGGTANYLRADGTWTAPSGFSGTLAQLNTAITDADVPAALNGLVAVWKGTAAQYAAVSPKDANTVYFVTA